MDIENLNKKDVIVFWGGTSDVSKNNIQKGLRQLVGFVMKNKHTNIVVMSVSHRHDLAYRSCVNKEVENFNRKLLKFIKPLGHVKVIKVESNREYFTRHGLHLNNEGKEQVIRKVANVIILCFKNIKKNRSNYSGKLNIMKGQTSTCMEKVELDKKEKKWPLQ
jgi:hypothetical protein